MTVSNQPMFARAVRLSAIISKCRRGDLREQDDAACLQDDLDEWAEQSYDGVGHHRGDYSNQAACDHVERIVDPYVDPGECVEGRNGQKCAADPAVECPDRRRNAECQSGRVCRERRVRRLVEQERHFVIDEWAVAEDEVVEYLYRAIAEGEGEDGGDYAVLIFGTGRCVRQRTRVPRA